MGKGMTRGRGVPSTHNQLVRSTQKHLIKDINTPPIVILVIASGLEVACVQDLASLIANTRKERKAQMI